LSELLQRKDIELNQNRALLQRSEETITKLEIKISDLVRSLRSLEESLFGIENVRQSKEGRPNAKESRRRRPFHHNTDIANTG